MQARMEQPIDDLPVLEMPLHNLWHIVQLDSAIPDVIRQHTHRRTHIALSLTAAVNNRRDRLRLLLERLQHLSRAVGKAICVLANENLSHGF